MIGFLDHDKLWFSVSNAHFWLLTGQWEYISCSIDLSRISDRGGHTRRSATVGWQILSDGRQILSRRRRNLHPGDEKRYFRGEPWPFKGTSGVIRRKGKWLIPWIHLCSTDMSAADHPQAKKREPRRARREETLGRAERFFLPILRVIGGRVPNAVPFPLQLTRKHDAMCCMVTCSGNYALFH